MILDGRRDHLLGTAMGLRPLRLKRNYDSSRILQSRHPIFPIWSHARCRPIKSIGLLIQKDFCETDYSNSGSDHLTYVCIHVSKLKGLNLTKKNLIISINNPYVFREYIEKFVLEVKSSYNIWIVLQDWSVPQWLRDYLQHSVLIGDISGYQLVNLEPIFWKRRVSAYKLLDKISGQRFDCHLSDDFGFGITKWISTHLTKDNAKRYCFYPAGNNLARNMTQSHSVKRKSLIQAIENYGIMRTILFVLHVYLLGMKRGVRNITFGPLNDFPLKTNHWSLLATSGFDEIFLVTPEEVELFGRISEGPTATRVRVPGYKSANFAYSSLIHRENKLLIILPGYGIAGIPKIASRLYRQYLEIICRELDADVLCFRLHPGTSRIVMKDIVKIANELHKTYMLTTNDLPLINILEQFIGVAGPSSSALRFCRQFATNGHVVLIDDERLHSTAISGMKHSASIFGSDQLDVLNQNSDVIIPPTAEHAGPPIIRKLSEIVRHGA